MTEREKLSAAGVRARKGGEKLAMISAYDYPTAHLAEAAGLDILLVGDSVGMVILGYESTVPVTVEEILHHTRAVVRGASAVHVVADLPFMSYQVSNEQAVANAGRLIKEGGADAVKVEGAGIVAERIRAIVAAGIPVMGHVGLTPQSAGGTGGFRVHGRDLASALAVLSDAEAVVAAGVYSLVIEAVPAELGALITAQVPVPTIGIGAGPDCDGQVLVSTDLLGIESPLSLRFAKRYADLGESIRSAFATYAAEVRGGVFPDAEHSFTMKPEVAAALRQAVEDADRHDPA